MAESAIRQLAQQRLQSLLALARDDGSWPYRRGGAGLTEATCFSLLACRALGTQAPKEDASFAWLEERCLTDGGCTPHASVAMANWVTALVSLACGAYGRTALQRRNLQWLIALKGNESAWLGRTVRNTLGVKTPYPQKHAGWPWMEDTASWVAPTALALLALRQARAGGQFPALYAAMDERIREAAAMLLERRCSDGGWNHGAPAALEVSATSYPETTGMATLALGRDASDSREGLVRVAETMLTRTRSAAALSWLQLGLMALDRTPAALDESAVACRTSLDFALRTLALGALGGNNILKV